MAANPDRLHAGNVFEETRDALRTQGGFHLRSHQIWLLKIIFWWYLLPIAATVLFSVFWSECRSAKPGSEKWVDLLVSVGVIALVNWSVYWLNQFAVRKELEALLDSLEPGS